MGKQDGSLVIGSLSYDELTKSIDKLVNYVGNQTTIMADKFTKAMDIMKGSMKDFAITQKVSVDLMKQAWRSMSESFDAMVRAQERATSGSKGKQQTPFEYHDLELKYTLGELIKMKSETDAYRKTLEKSSDEIKRANTYYEKLVVLIKQAKQELKIGVKDAVDAKFLPEGNLNELKIKRAVLQNYIDAVERGSFLQRYLKDELIAVTAKINEQGAAFKKSGAAMKEQERAAKEEAQALKELLSVVDKQRKTDLERALKMPEGNLQQAEAKLQAISTVLDKINTKDLLSPAKVVAVENTVASLKERIVQLRTEMEKTNRSQTQQPMTAQDYATEMLKRVNRERAEVYRMLKEASQRMQNELAPKIAPIEEKLQAAKQKLQEYVSEFDALLKKTNLSATESTRAEVVSGNIERLKREIADYQKQIANAPSYFNAKNRQEVEDLRAIFADLTKKAKDFQRALSGSERKRTADDRATYELQKQVQLIQQSTEWQERGVALVRSSVSNTTSYIVRKEHELSLEEQLLRIKKEEEELRRRANQSSTRTTRVAEIGPMPTAAELSLIPAAREVIESQTVALQRNRQVVQATFSSYNSLREAMASVLKVSSSSIKNVDFQTSSQEKLSAALKQATQAYSKLSAEQAKTKMGQDLINYINRLKFSIRELQSQMNRPISLGAALALPAKSIDQIGYKIQQLRAYMNGLDITNTNSVKEIGRVNQAISQLEKQQQKLIGTNSNLINSNNALSRSWNYMKNRLAFYFTVGASTQFVKQLIDIRSQYEMNERALGILIGSAEYGTKVFKELSQMALVSPYTLIELSNAARQLTAYGVAAKDVVDTTRRLADMAAAVGVPMERLTYALGQIQAYGYLNARDARMFSNAGIPLVRELADYYTQLEGKLVSVSDIYDRIKKKAIGYNDVMSVVNKMTDEGGRFFDFQAKMAGTLKVQLANLTLAWNNMLNDIGKNQQGILTWTIGALKQFFLHWKKVDAVIWDLILAFGAFKLGQFMFLLSRGVLARAEGWYILIGKKLTTAIKSLGATIKTVFTSAGTWVTIAIMAFFDLMQVVKQANDAIHEFNNSIAEGSKERNENIKKQLESLNDVYTGLYTWKKNDSGKYEITGTSDLNNAEAQKAWETIKTLIEETASTSSNLVGKLLDIDDVNKRLRKSFDYVNDIKAVNAAMEELSENTFEVTQSYAAWWNIWLGPDGLVENLKDYYNTLDKVLQKQEELGYRPKNLQDNLTVDAGKALEDAAKFTDSLLAFVSQRNFNIDQEMEAVARATDKFIEEANLGNKNSIRARIDLEEIYIESRKKKFDEEIAFEERRQQHATTKVEQERYAARVRSLRTEKEQWLKQFGEYRSGWSEFTKWMNSQHSYEIMHMFANMTKQERDHYIKSSPEFKKWAKENAESFSQQFGTSFEKLYAWVKEANNWTIFINAVITGNTKSEFDSLSEYDKLADEAYNKIKRLNTRISELNKTTNKTTRQQNELTTAIEERTQAQKDLNDAESKGGHSKSKEADAKRAAQDARKNANANKKLQREQESELQKAIKNELSLIDKLRSNYKKLVDAGESPARALGFATSGYDKAVKAINDVLKKYGVAEFKADKYAGVSEPQKLVDLLNAQLNAIIKSGLSKPKEIEDLQVKIQELGVDAKTYNLKKITDGLNSELANVKDQYELAVELDANPELSDIFTEMFDIDPDLMSSNIDDLVDRYKDKVNYYIAKVAHPNEKNIDYDQMKESLDILKDDLDEWAKRTGRETTDELFKTLESKQKELRSIVKKYNQDLIKQTKDLEYKLADNTGKIAIEQEKLDRLEAQLEKERDVRRRNLLRLQIQQQKETIAKLKSEILRLMPTYRNLFNSIVEHSTYATKKIANSWKQALMDAKKVGDEYVVTDPLDGTETYLSKDDREKRIDEVNKKLRESQIVFDKIKESFTKGEDNMIDWVKGIELIGGEAHKAAEIIKELGSVVGQLGGDEETVEIFNDIAESIDGIATASQGFTQIMNGDVLGGSLNVVKGLWQSVSSWFDNGNKRIDRAVKRSERSVKQLEIAYSSLEYAINKSMGTAEISARRAAIENKKLQLAELERQLALEQSRKSKNQDEDKILDLQGQVQDLKRQIQDDTEDIANTLFGNDIKSAAEDFVSTWVQAWRAGEDTMDALNGKFDDMIDNMIVKAIASKVVAQKLQPIFDMIDTISGNETDAEMLEKLKQISEFAKGGSISSGINEYLKTIYEYLGIGYGSGNKDAQLSALQQGIQGITEETAGALEAYMNGVSQQVYYQSGVLTEIRDAVLMMGGDVHMATQAQMLLQLQQSYAVQMAIQSILEGWSSANGMSVRVELTN